VSDLLGVSPIVGPDVTEAAFMACERPRILHLATHGWFLPAADYEGETPPWMSHPRLSHLKNLTYLTRPGVIVMGVNAEFSQQLYDQLLVRCGLVTAGFNTAWAGLPLPEAGGDGLVTGADVAELDLHGTELVVLSACETGLGQAIDFEGIYGLRRAFETAGAANLITALWQVADESTTTFMGEFYERLSADAMPSRILRETQLAVRRTLPHPYFWGGFACQATSGGMVDDFTAEASGEEAEIFAEAGIPAGSTELARSATEYFTHGDIEMANRLWQEAAEAGDARSAHNLAVGLQERGLLDEAVAWYRQAAASGLAQSANNLGELLWARDDLDGAEEWLRRALDLGYEPAAATLGHALESSGNSDEAARMWRRAARFDPLAALKLAEFLNGDNDTAEAMTWWRVAAEGGLIAGALRFGDVLFQVGDYEQSEIWLRRAAEVGSAEAVQLLEDLRSRRQPEATRTAEVPAPGEQEEEQEDTPHALAQLMVSQGEAGKAEALLRPFADQHEAWAAHMLGVLLCWRGELDEAERYLRQAADSEPEAKNDLALLLWKRGQHTDAERLWTEAAGAGSDEAARNLAAGLEEIGRFDDALPWWRVSAEAGNTYAAYGLGTSLYHRGAADEAERWFRRAALAGEVVAMSSLGRLLAHRGDPEAEQWLRRSADAGVPGEAIVLSQILAARGEREEAEIWRQRAVREAQVKDGNEPG
jgi:TPR repeat protein